MKLENAVEAGEARRFYDWLGAGHDIGASLERAAKALALTLLDMAPGQRVLNAGVGTGKEQQQIRRAIAPHGVAVGVDLSPVMLELTRTRLAWEGPPPLSVADARTLPFTSNVFDRLFCSYLLDLIPARELPQLLSEFRRVLKPSGRLVNISLTEGTTLSSRALITAWKAVYRVSPLALGGCRPLRLSYAFLKAGFSDVQREVIIQKGMPSEIIIASY